jgi:hypothetical protein
MNFFRKYSRYIIATLIGFLAGFLLQKIFHPFFDEKLDPIELAGIVLTIILALYVEFVIRPSFSNKESVRNVILQQVTTIKEQLIGIHQVFIASREKTPLPENEKMRIVSSFRTLSNEINFLKEIIEYSRIAPTQTRFQTIFKEYLKYKKNVTGFRFEDPTFSYDRKFFIKIDNSHKEFMKTLIHLIIELNQS